MQSLINDDDDNDNLPGLVFLQCSLGGTWASHTNYTEVMTPKLWKLKSQRYINFGTLFSFFVNNLFVQFPGLAQLFS